MTVSTPIGTTVLQTHNQTPTTPHNTIPKNTNQRPISKVPEQEDHDLTPATRLLEKRREMQEVENGLIQQKEEFNMKMESLTQRREELSRKETQLKESLVKFDKFLKENDAKRNRAIKKALDERKTREMKEADIISKKDETAVLSVKKERSTRAVENHIIYQRFMESVLESAEEFGEIKDIILRFDTLSATNQELIERARKVQEKTETDRMSFITSTEEKNNLILNYNNEIAKLQTKLEEAQLKSGKCQLEWDLALKNATAKTLQLGQIKMATNNLFQLVKGHLNSRLFNSTDTLVQLDKIQQFILDLSSIASDYTPQGTIVPPAPGQSKNPEVITTST
ncbi:Cilia- and flagella-associated protein 73 [Blyttiomyces sp. JEL0837]|nr:Cilia- and flagella-associated protein 73 [Blyttiomyces sp. JEL0837]